MEKEKTGKGNPVFLVCIKKRKKEKKEDKKKESTEAHGTLFLFCFFYTTTSHSIEYAMSSYNKDATLIILLTIWKIINHRIQTVGPMQTYLLVCDEVFIERR